MATFIYFTSFIFIWLHTTHIRLSQLKFRWVRHLEINSITTSLLQSFNLQRLTSNSKFGVLLANLGRFHKGLRYSSSHRGLLLGFPVASICRSTARVVWNLLIERGANVNVKSDIYIKKIKSIGSGIAFQSILNTFSAFKAQLLVNVNFITENFAKICINVAWSTNRATINDITREILENLHLSRTLSTNKQGIIALQYFYSGQFTLAAIHTPQKKIVHFSASISLILITILISIYHEDPYVTSMLPTSRVWQHLHTS